MRKDTGLKMNPLEEELQRWAAKEQLYQKTLGAVTVQSKSFLKVKYKHLRSLQRQFKDSKDKDVKASLKILKGHLRTTRRQLYPRWQRWTADIARAAWKTVGFIFKQVRNAAKIINEKQRERRLVSNAPFDTNVLATDNKQDASTKAVSQQMQQPLLKSKRRDQPRVLLNAPRLGKGIS